MAISLASQLAGAGAWQVAVLVHVRSIGVRCLQVMESTAERGALHGMDGHTPTLSSPVAPGRGAAHSNSGKRRLDELAVVDAFPDRETALRAYLRLHRDAPLWELYVVHG